MSPVVPPLLQATKKPLGEGRAEKILSVLYGYLSFCSCGLLKASLKDCCKEKSHACYAEKDFALFVHLKNRDAWGWG